MLAYITRRLLLMIPTLLLISILSFTIIQLPPGDYLTTYMANLAQTGEAADEALLASLRTRYGLDLPMPVQYLKWMGGVLRGDFGQSFTMQKPVKDLIWERLSLTFLIAFFSILLTYVIAVPIGIYSATRQYTVGDYTVTFLGFVGLATPPFLLALVLQYVSYTWFDTSIGGLFSDELVDAPWSWAKIKDLLEHLWIPVAILSLAGTAGTIRTLRANLLDQLQMPYVETARAKGLPEWRILIKYPVRMAINPMISTLGWMLPYLVSGSVIVATVLGLPTTGPLMLTALMEQDMYLAGTFVMMLSVLTVVGTLISDILLVLVDPRIRFERQQR